MIVSEIALGIDQSGPDFPIIPNTDLGNYLEKFCLIDYDTLEKIVLSMSNKSSVDDINVEFLKNCLLVYQKLF